MFLTQSRCQTKLFPPILAYLRADLDNFKTKAQPSFQSLVKKKKKIVDIINILCGRLKRGSTRIVRLR